MAFAEAQARTAGLGALRLYTNALMEPNIALYGRLGYEITEAAGPGHVTGLHDEAARRLRPRSPALSGAGGRLRW